MAAVAQSGAASPSEVFDLNEHELVSGEFGAMMPLDDQHGGAGGGAVGGHEHLGELDFTHEALGWHGALQLQQQQQQLQQLQQQVQQQQVQQHLHTNAMQMLGSTQMVFNQHGHQRRGPGGSLGGFSAFSSLGAQPVPATTGPKSHYSQVPPPPPLLSLRGQPQPPQPKHTLVQSDSSEKKPKSSSFIGVSFNLKTRRWKSLITIDKKQVFLGYFTSEEEAARAYDRASRQHRGGEARCNFSIDGKKVIHVYPAKSAARQRVSETIVTAKVEVDSDEEESKQQTSPRQGRHDLGGLSASYASLRVPVEDSPRSLASPAKGKRGSLDGKTATPAPSSSASSVAAAAQSSLGSGSSDSSLYRGLQSLLAQSPRQAYPSFFAPGMPTAASPSLDAFDSAAAGDVAGLQASAGSEGRAVPSPVATQAPLLGGDLAAISMSSVPAGAGTSMKSRPRPPGLDLESSAQSEREMESLSRKRFKSEETLHSPHASSPLASSFSGSTYAATSPRAASALTPSFSFSPGYRTPGGREAVSPSSASLGQRTLASPTSFLSGQQTLQMSPSSFSARLEERTPSHLSLLDALGSIAAGGASAAAEASLLSSEAQAAGTGTGTARSLLVSKQSFASLSSTGSSAAGSSNKGDKSSRFRGVAYNKRNNKYKSVLTHKGKQHFLGYFATEEEAARAYDAACVKLRGNGFLMNFEPEPGEPGAPHFLGVIRSPSGKWKVVVPPGSPHVSNKTVMLYDTEEEAAKAYDREAKRVSELSGVQLELNFPGEESESPSRRRRGSSDSTMSLASPSSASSRASATKASGLGASVFTFSPPASPSAATAAAAAAAAAATSPRAQPLRAASRQDFTRPAAGSAASASQSDLFLHLGEGRRQLKAYSHSDLNALGNMHRLESEAGLKSAGSFNSTDLVNQSSRLRLSSVSSAGSSAHSLLDITGLQRLSSSGSMGLTQPSAPMSSNVSVLSLLDNNGEEREDGLMSLLPSTVRQKSFDEHQEDGGEENEEEEEDAREDVHEDVHGLGHSDLQDIGGI